MPSKKNKHASTSTHCKHRYIKTDGVITCFTCDLRAILYLKPLVGDPNTP